LLFTINEFFSCKILNYGYYLKMASFQEVPYINPQGLARPIPFERFLPICPPGIVSQILSTGSENQNWMLDPFGSNPLLALDTARCGQRILVACNNPIIAFSLRLLANIPEKQQYLSALAEFASLRRGEERLETHIQALYRTRCVICHQEIQAAGFLWHRADPTPYARVYNCPHCGDEGERAITEEDLLILQPLQRGEKIHRARAMSMVLRTNEEDRPTVEDALRVYNSRALYVLFTLLNKLEGMDLPDERRQYLEALMISLLDVGTSLWSWPDNSEQPHQLTLPTDYIEKNLWTELENAVDLWSQPAIPLEFTTWPNLPSSAGICLFPGPIRALEELPSGVKIDGLLCLPPRPNQAFWTLSALWSAWLWGKESSTSFRNVLGRRRFDWHWHTRALHQALEKAVHFAQPGSQVFLQIGEPSPGMVLASFASSTAAGCRFDNIAYKSPEDVIQIHLQTNKSPAKDSTPNLQSVARKAIVDTLLDLGEPCDYLRLYTAALSAVTKSGGFPVNIQDYSSEKSAALQGMIARLFVDRDFLRRHEASSQELDSGKWGLVNLEGCQPPLADRVEIEIVNLLQKGKTLPSGVISKQLNQNFFGLLTPPNDLVEFCLTSYANWNQITQEWELKEHETITKRRKEMAEASKSISALGKKLGFICSGEAPLTWQNSRGVQYKFYFSAGAILSKFACLPVDENVQSVLVFPGSRSSLLKFKLLRDPQLRERTTSNWHFLKLRALNALISRPDLSLINWPMFLDSDPINLEETTQLRMFG
jgi:hypothetical protein